MNRTLGNQSNWLTIVGNRIYYDYSIALVFVRLLMEGVILCRDCCLLWLIDRLFVCCCAALLLLVPEKEPEEQIQNSKCSKNGFHFGALTLTLTHWDLNLSLNGLRMYHNATAIASKKKFEEIFLIHSSPGEIRTRLSPWNIFFNITLSL